MSGSPDGQSAGEQHRGFGMCPISLTRLWTETPDRPFGLLLLPADNGGQAVTVRVGRLTARFEVDVWRQKR